LVIVVALAACEHAAPADGGADAGDAAVADDAAAADAAAGADDNSPAETCAKTETRDGGPTLDDFPIGASDCAPDVRAFRWDEPCAGSVAVISYFGADCSSWDLYDATTKAWQASGVNCLGGPGRPGFCNVSVPGFVLPSTCFDLTASTSICAADGGVD
jgi:hypothetical protein